jgi:hypothetical protein
MIIYSLIYYIYIFVNIPYLHFFYLQILIDYIFRMKTVAIIVSILLVLLFVVLSLWENGLFKLHPSLMAVSVSLIYLQYLRIIYI